MIVKNHTSILYNFEVYTVHGDCERKEKIIRALILKQEIRRKFI